VEISFNSPICFHGVHRDSFSPGFMDQDYFYLMDTTEYISSLYFIMEVKTALTKL